jgi:hypothetical protein
MRKSDRSVIGALVSRLWKPAASRKAMFPPRATPTTAPAMCPAATYSSRIAEISSSGSDESPAAAGDTRGIGVWAVADAEDRTNVKVRRIEPNGRNMRCLQVADGKLPSISYGIRSRGAKEDARSIRSDFLGDE